jgi:hypothetical protein
MHVSLFVSSNPILFEVAGPPAAKEYDSEETLHFCEDERSSSPRLSWSVFSLARIMTMIENQHQSSMMNLLRWEHGSFILETPQKPCSSNTSPESATLSVVCLYKDHNHLLVLSSKTFRRIVVDAFVYHKHCKFRGCTMALTLQLKHQFNEWQ